MAVRELGPGVWDEDGQIHLCPGCAAEHFEGSAICTRDWIIRWAKNVAACIERVGGQPMPEGYAEELADRYLKEPWHEYE